MWFSHDAAHITINFSDKFVLIFCDKTLDYFRNKFNKFNQSRTNGPINAHLTIAQVMPKYNHNNEKQEALL